jgi:hypothetical protein
MWQHIAGAMDGACDDKFGLKKCRITPNTRIFLHMQHFSAVHKNPTFCQAGGFARVSGGFQTPGGGALQGKVTPKIAVQSSAWKEGLTR